MIFFGSRRKLIAGHVIDGVQCPYCENQRFITFGTIRYFHLYWIPTFPLSKKVGIECVHCKRTLLGKEIPSDLSKQIKAELFTKNKVLPMFSGLILISCLVVVGVLAVKQTNVQEAKYIEQPIENDLYLVNFEGIYPDTDPVYKYGLMRIKKVYSDQIEFQVSSIAYNKMSGVRKDIREYKTSEDSYYDETTLYLDAEEVKNMKESGTIQSIERP